MVLVSIAAGLGGKAEAGVITLILPTCSGSIMMPASAGSPAARIVCEHTCLRRILIGEHACPDLMNYVAERRLKKTRKKKSGLGMELLNLSGT